MIPLYRWTIGTGSSFSTATKCTVPLTMPSGGPLPFSEVQSTASSIARWTRRNFISKSEYQAKRGRIGGIKSGEKRRQAREAQITEVFG